MRQLILRCKADKRKGLWLLAKTNDTYAKFMKEDYQDEAKYINSLSDDDKIWLNTFLQGYYHQSKPAMDKLKFPVMLRRARYNQHRGAKSDFYNKRTREDLHSPSKGSNHYSKFDNLVLDVDGFGMLPALTPKKKRAEDNFDV